MLTIDKPIFFCTQDRSI